MTTADNSVLRFEYDEVTLFKSTLTTHLKHTHDNRYQFSTINSILIEPISAKSHAVVELVQSTKPQLNNDTNFLINV